MALAVKGKKMRKLVLGSTNKLCQLFSLRCNVRLPPFKLLAPADGGCLSVLFSLVN
jgi:hypothetical protein